MKGDPRCAFCYGVILAPWREFHLDLHDTHGARVTLHWHWECVDGDPLMARIANCENPCLDEETAGAEYAAALDELHARTPVEHLKGVFQVRRDLALPFTLRAPGAQWGRPVRVVKQ